MPHSLTAAAPREAALSLCALCPLPAAPTPSYAQGMPKSHSRVPRAATPSLVLRPSSSRTQALHTPTVAWDLLPSTCPASHASPKQEHSCRPLCKRLTTTPVIAARCMTAARTRPLRALCTRARARMPHTILRSPRRRRAAAAEPPPPPMSPAAVDCTRVRVLGSPRSSCEGRPLAGPPPGMIPGSMQRAPAGAPSAGLPGLPHSDIGRP